MSKILCITSGLTGITNASLELVSRLIRVGHEVVYASPRDKGEVFKNMGIRYFQLPEIKMDLSPEIPEFKGPLRKIKRITYKYRFKTEWEIAAVKQIEPIEFIDILKKEKFNLMIVDMELHEYIISAYEQKVPILLLSQWFSVWRRKGLPYILTDHLPNESSILVFLKWTKVNLQRKWTFFRKRIFSAGTDRRSLLLKLARQKKFPESYIGENYWPGPFLYDVLPVMSMTAKELEFPHHFRTEHHYVGPVVYKERKEVVDDLLSKAIINAKKSGQKIIYCSLSTLHAGDVTFIKQLISVVEKRKEWFLIVGLGGKIAAQDFNETQSNIILMDRVPQLYVLNRADCSINHGGIHTINECIVYRVPMLVYSGKRSDQNGCAARVHYHEVGIMADKDKDDEIIISAKIHEILTNKKYLRNIEKLSNNCNNYIENKTIENIVHEYISEKK